MGVFNKYEHMSGGGGGNVWLLFDPAIFTAFNCFHVGLLAILQVVLEYTVSKIMIKLIIGTIVLRYVKYYSIKGVIEFVIQYLSNQSKYLLI